VRARRVVGPQSSQRDDARTGGTARFARSVARSAFGFEVSLFGYYLMSVSVVLLLMEIAVGRIRLMYIGWTAIATWATVAGGLVDHGTFVGVDVRVWQVLIVIGAVYLAACPLFAATELRITMEPTRA